MPEQPKSRKYREMSKETLKWKLDSMSSSEQCCGRSSNIQHLLPAGTEYASEEEVQIEGQADFWKKRLFVTLPHGFPGCGSSLLPFDTIRQSVCLVETPGEHVAQDFLLRFQVSARHNFENKKGQLPDKGFTFPSSAFTTHLAVLGLMEREPTCCANSVTLER